MTLAQAFEPCDRELARRMEALVDRAIAARDEAIDRGEFDRCPGCGYCGQLHGRNPRRCSWCGWSSEHD